MNASDELGARANQRNFTNPALIDFAYDFNRDGKVDATDQLIARGILRAGHDKKLAREGVDHARIFVGTPSTGPAFASRWSSVCTVAPCSDAVARCRASPARSPSVY